MANAKFDCYNGSRDKTMTQHARIIQKWMLFQKGVSQLCFPIYVVVYTNKNGDDFLGRRVNDLIFLGLKILIIINFKVQIKGLVSVSDSRR